ncbi:energy transducer TonB [Sphingobacterium spiritivorum]|uniref:energy transducer TonB n=1 Tax=Sphingobacterium spiritivorum TaxID=258 RepID=UPI003DA54C00
MLGSKLNIYKKEWLEVIFQGRNQSYGAYELRQLSPRATNYSLAIVTTVVLLCSMGKFAYDHMPGEQYVAPVMEVTPVTLDDLVEKIPEEKIEDPLPAENQPKQIAQDPPALDLIRFPEPTVVDARKAKDDVAAQDDFKDDKKSPARLTLKAMPGGSAIARGEFGDKKKDGEITGKSTGTLSGGDDKIHNIVALEIQPEPIGGIKAFMKWVGDNYQYPSAALEQGVNGVVMVSFVIEKDGSLTDIKVGRDLNFGTGDAAIALLKKARKWNPGIQNGRPVRVAYSLPIRLNTIQQ